MDLKVTYDNGDGTTGSKWFVIAAASNLKMANLCSFFKNDGSNSAIMDAMRHLSVPSVAVRYTYTSNQPSELHISGVIVIGPIQFGLEYSHKKGEEWIFKADVMASEELQTKEVTLASLLHDLLDDSVGDSTSSIPVFVRNLAISLAKIKGGIRCSSVTDSSVPGRPVKYVVFSLQIEVESFSFTFAQIQRYDDIPNTSANKRRKPTRILRFGIKGFPEIGGVEVVGNFKQPFDELGLVWASMDLTRPKIQALEDAQAFPRHSPLLVKKDLKETKSGTKAAKPEVLLQRGCHFQVILHESSTPSLVLDYAFGGDNTGDTSHSSNAGKEPPSGPATIHTPTTASGGGNKQTAMTPLSKTMGPLTVRNIGLKAESSSKIVISLDASIQVGPVGLSLLGFAIGLDFKDVQRPSQFTQVKPQFDIDGLAGAFDRPPARLAGLFAKKGASYYEGGVVISIGAWSAMAVGVYEEHEFKSVFVFGVLRGPMLNFGCVEIDGIVGGFGYNSHLALPDVTRVSQFPLVVMNRALAEPSEDLLTQLTVLTQGPGMQCISPKQDSLWLAAGK
jgi:hypothetical protein